jgi:hypothetical protein
MAGTEKRDLENIPETYEKAWVIFSALKNIHANTAKAKVVII